MNELIKFWQDFKIEQPYVHPNDKEIIDLDNNYITVNSYDDYINNSGFGSDETKFHLNLIPIPYIGNIEKAKIYILMLNPGFGILDYYAESKDVELKSTLINNLRQENLARDYPFIFLNPKFLWHGGGQYWEKKFKELIKEVKDDNNYSYAQTLSFIAKRVAVLQLVPYHSRKSKQSDKLYTELKSSIQMRKFVQKLAKQGEKYIICMRGKNYWNLEEDDNVIVYSGNQSTAAHLSSKTLGMKKWKKLRDFLI